MAISKVLVFSFSGSYLVRVRMICSSSFLDGFLILFFEELTESSFSSFF